MHRHLPRRDPIEAPGHLTPRDRRDWRCTRGDHGNEVELAGAIENSGAGQVGSGIGGSQGELLAAAGVGIAGMPPVSGCHTRVAML